MSKNTVVKMSKNTVVMAYEFKEGGPIRYCLFAFNVDQVVGGFFGCGRKTSISTTLLEMKSADYPIAMGFVFMESLNKLYMIGGHFKVNHTIYSSDKVYSVDLLRPFSELSVQEAPSMLCGKSNPIAIDAFGKIYVLGSSTCDCSFHSNHYSDDETSKHMMSFEEFNPQSGTWSVLRGPKPPFIDCSKEIVGHVVARKMIILHAYPGTQIAAYQVDYHQWEYYNYQTHLSRLNPNFDTLLLMNLSKEGLFGKGVVVGDTTLLTFNTKVTDNQAATATRTLNAHHISDQIRQKSRILGPVLGFQRPIEFSGLVIQEENLLHLGDDNLCCVISTYQPHADSNKKKKKEEAQPEVCIKMFRVYIDGCFCGGGIPRADVVNSFVLQGINTKLGSLICSFTLQSKTIKDKGSKGYVQLLTKKKIIWKRDNLVAASVYIASAGLIAAAGYRFIASIRSR